ncbi:MAG: flagellar export chaperone FliS [Candidatus Solibacter usitatus]|nr:flagellar export chaperone FliS [Candidatus Solibacter usitatus]
MMSNPYGDHLAEAVNSASPLELVVLLYSKLNGSVTAARRCLASGDIAGRARHVSRAMEILAELSSALDVGRGGDVAVNLASIYAFALVSLQEANSTQSDGPLEVTERVLAPLTEAWRELCPEGCNGGAPPVEVLNLRSPEGAPVSCCG